jgi:hypothetical protein
MFKALRTRLSYTNVVATLALFFAMSGGALAAGHYLISSTKQISPKVLKALQGKAGASGAQGLAGAAGPQGPAGSAGAKGEPGAAGKEGPAGESVTSAALGKGEGGCAEGGSKFTVGGKETTACNGTMGFTERLPKGKTETGVWDFSVPMAETGAAFAPISFSIPLGEELNEHQVEFVEEGQTTKECPGTLAQPKAEPGTLCVYGFAIGATSDQIVKGADVFVKGASVTGAFVDFILNPGEELKEGFGTWAVTPESE